MPSMAPITPKQVTDDVSLVVAIIDTNPYFWASSSPSLSFSLFLSHLLSFVNSILLLNQLNQVVIIATGNNNCDYVFDSSVLVLASKSSGNARMPRFCEGVIKNLEEFLSDDEALSTVDTVDGVGCLLLAGSLSMAMCYIQLVFRSGPLHPQPRILCLHGSPDGSEQYVSVMNAIFSAQHSMVPIDFCVVGAQHSAFLQQASYITGGVYLKPQKRDGLSQYLSVPIDSCVVGAQHSAFLQQASYITGGVYLKPQQRDGLSQYLSTVFATDLQSRNFIQLPKPVGVDFRASCFCHKSTIDMGFICSVCLSIFCMDQKKCSTCGSIYEKAKANSSS